MNHEDEIQTHPVPRQNHAQWLQRLRSCDQATWDTLVRYYAGDLRQDIVISLRRRNLNEDCLDDIEQETWITAIQCIQDFVWESQEKFYHWLRIIALNHVRRYQRSEQQMDNVAGHDKNELDGELERFVDVWKAQEAAIEDTVIVSEMYMALDKALRTLKPREQEILMLWLNGKKPREIASIYAMKVPTVSMLLLRAKERIRANISPTYPFGEDK